MWTLNTRGEIMFHLLELTYAQSLDSDQPQRTSQCWSPSHCFKTCPTAAAAAVAAARPFLSVASSTGSFCRQALSVSPHLAFPLT